MNSNHPEIDILSTTAFLTIYYFTSIALILLSGITAALSPELETLIPVSGETLNALYNAGTLLLGIVPVVLMTVVILSHPAVITIKAIKNLRCKKPEEIRKDCIEHSSLVVIYGLTGCLLPQIAYICAAYVGYHLDFAHILPDLITSCSLISLVTILSVPLYFIPNLCIIINSCKKSHGEKQI